MEENSGKSPNQQPEGQDKEAQQRRPLAPAHMRKRLGDRVGGLFGLGPVAVEHLQPLEAAGSQAAVEAPHRERRVEEGEDQDLLYQIHLKEIQKIDDSLSDYVLAIRRGAEPRQDR